jgi:CotH kinase protein/Lamin Tail Domain/Chitobiase/beta-hexosaminidase C-terminal domain
MRYLYFLSLLLMSTKAFGQIVINEYSAANLKQFTDAYDKYEDWIELYNAGNSAVNIQGWYLSDDDTAPTKWKIANSTSIGAGQFRIFYCSGRNQGNHTNFKLSQTKGTPDIIVLANASGTIVDSKEVKKTKVHQSRGRSTDGAATWDIFTEPTPLDKNADSPAFSNFANRPDFSLAAGFYNTAQVVTITNNEPNSVIRYTLNGTEPTQFSPLYSGPITIATTTVLKAAAWSSNPAILPGFMEFATYFINANHNLVVVSVSADTLLELANGDQPLRPVGAIEYFNTSKVRTARSYGELNSHGQDSWVNDQRSLDWISRDEMGYSRHLSEKIFSLNERENYQRLILRAAGDDNYPDGSGTPGGGAHLRDAYIQNLAKIHNLNLDVRAGEKAVVYLNGQYWGVYDLRELPDDHDYTDHNFNQGKYDLQYLLTWGDTWAEYGGQKALDDWQKTQDYILGHDMRTKANFDSAAAMVDLASLTDYILVQSGTVCSDWLNYNTGWWRGTNPAGGHKKWGFILWDNDATFGYYINYTGIPDTSATALPCDVDTLQFEQIIVIPDETYVVQPGEIFEFEGVTYVFGDTVFIAGFTFEQTSDVNEHMKTWMHLRKNPEFNRQVITRYADLNNTMFRCDNMLNYLDTQYKLIKPEMTRHINRWGGTYQGWENNYAQLKDFVGRRCVALEEGMRDCYNLTGPNEVTFTVDPVGEGALQINSLEVKNFPYTGKYYGGIDNRLAASAINAGTYKFDKWSANNTTSAPSNLPITLLDFTGNSTVVAKFVKVNSSTNDPFEKDYSLTLLPNLISSEAQITIQIAEIQSVKLEVINTLGQVQATLLNQAQLGQGSHTLTCDVNAAGLATGTYHLRIITEKGYQKSIPFVVMAK